MSRVGENPATNRSDRHRSGVLHICVDLQDSSVTEMFIMVSLCGGRGLHHCNKLPYVASRCLGQ